jgi:hypothetical protein
MEREQAKYVPVATLATVLAEKQRAWTDDDLEAVPWSSEPLVKDEAWQRLQREAEQQVCRAITAGELEAKGKGAGLKVRAGSFEPGWARRRPWRPPGPRATRCGRTLRRRAYRLREATWRGCVRPWPACR